MKPATRRGRPRVRWTPSSEPTDWTPCSLAIQLWDHLTQSPPLGPPRVVLEREGPAGQWHPVPRQATLTPSGLHTWLRLEHRRFAVGAPPVRHRLRVDSELYVPGFREVQDYEFFSIQPYDDRNVPPTTAQAPARVLLYPSAAYPFAPHLQVLRGSVVDGNGRPVRDAHLSQGTDERALTNAQGQYALPLRFVRPGPAVVHVKDRQGRTATESITVPQSLSTAVTITLR
jgi:hypothetical protein